MPFALVFIAVALIVAGFRGTQTCLFVLMKEDFGGQFLSWMAAIILIGALGYIKSLAPISSALLVLIIVVLALKNGTGFFSQLEAAIRSGSTIVPAGNVQPTVLTITPVAVGTSGQVIALEQPSQELSSLAAGGLTPL